MTTYGLHPQHSAILFVLFGLLSVFTLVTSGCCECCGDCVTCPSQCTCCNCTCCNCTCCCCNENTAAIGAGVSLALIIVIENVLLGVAIGLVIWKRIKVAKFLYNLQLPEFREIPQWLVRRWRAPSSPLPEVYEPGHTLKNPTYDLEESRCLEDTTKANEAEGPSELYEEVPTSTEIDMENHELEMQKGYDVYDIPEFPKEDQLEAYATTNLDGFGGEMLDPYAVTDVSQMEGQLGAYAFTDVPVGDLSNEARKLTSAEVHTDDKHSAASTKTATNIVSSGKPTTPKKNVNAVRDKGNIKTAVLPPVASKQLAVNKQSQSDTNGNKEKPLKGKTIETKQANLQNELAQINASSVVRPVAAPRSFSGSGKRDKAVSRAAGAVSDADFYKVKNIRIKFEDEERRRSKSYTETGWEIGIVQEDLSSSKPGKKSSKSSVKGKPKPLPKTKGRNANKMRERRASESGVEQYSKLDQKSQYASLEPHTGKETNQEEAKASMTHDSYSHLKR